MEQAFGLEIPQTLEEACHPARAALIISNMQEGVLGQLKNRADVIAKVGQALDAARAAGVRVFFTRYLTLPKEVAGVFQLRTAMAWQHVTSVADVHPWFLRDAPSFQIVPELAPRPSEAVFDGITLSGFEGTPLNIALRDCGITTIILAGVATEMGIEMNARQGAALGFIPVVVADACGAGDPQAAERSLASLRFLGDTLLTSVDELSGILGARD